MDQTGRAIGAPGEVYRDDHGEADAGVRDALSRSDGHDGYLRAVAALCTTRLLLPLLASGDGDLSAVSVVNGSGGRALLAFTGVDSLRAWRADARPVPATLDDLAATVGQAGADVLLVDGAGPHPLVLQGDLLDQLARGRRLVALEDGGFGWLYLADGA